jgi:hypothetical protein
VTSTEYQQHRTDDFAAGDKHCQRCADHKSVAVQKFTERQHAAIKNSGPAMCCNDAGHRQPQHQPAQLRTVFVMA